jgi:hypothetical protein
MAAKDASISGESPQDSRIVFRASNAVIANHIRIILSLYEIRAAVIQRDPLHLTAAVAEVVVAAADYPRALKELTQSPQQERSAGWECSHCGEPVPGSFDLCWNCDALHPSLRDDDHPLREDRSPATQVTMADQTGAPIAIVMSRNARGKVPS